MSPALAQATSAVPCDGPEVLSATYDFITGGWQDTPVDCALCETAEPVDGSSYLAIDQNADATTVTLIVPGCQITSYAQTSVGPKFSLCASADGGDAGTFGQSLTFAPGPGIIRLTVCFTCCLEA
jgi:hypothetical protein